jgi:methylenetetrahydrofolate dehydrogenase (NADP+)/methenyltetrahydrofolate cyclohydrolase
MSVIGKKVTIINRSDIVGKPLQNMLIQDNLIGNATVCLCHDKTPHETLVAACQQADIIVVAVGKPNFLTVDMVSEHSVVVDVGINRVNGKICGDVDFLNVSKKVKAISPCPGGIGPLTVSVLMQNTYKAWELANG